MRAGYIEMQFGTMKLGGILRNLCIEGQETWVSVLEKGKNMWMEHQEIQIPFLAQPLFYSGAELSLFSWGKK